MTYTDITRSALAVALDAAETAGQRLTEHFGNSTATVKRDGSLITKADMEADDLLARRLRQSFPEHGILSEEKDTTYHGQEYVWVIDPLDGTNNFALGLPFWGISIALLHRGELLLSVLEYPLLRERAWAIRGQGAFYKGVRFHARPDAGFGKNEFIALGSRSWRYLDIHLPNKPRVIGCASYDLLLVARGVCTLGCLINPHIWDIAGGYLVIQEAGGVVAPLISEAPPPFPLQPRRDYGRQAFPTLSGANAEVFHQGEPSIHLKPSASSQLRQLIASS